MADKLLETKMPDKKALIEQYMNTLTEKEKKAYEIAKSHLGSSFSMENSWGFIKWKKTLTS